MVTAIKRVSPFGTELNMSVKAGVTIQPGQGVTITASNVAGVGALTQALEPIGWALYDHAHTAIKGRTAFGVGEIVPIRLRAPVVTVTCNGAGASAGDFLQATDSGLYVGQGTVKTVASAGIAIEAKTGTQEIMMIPI